MPLNIGELFGSLSWNHDKKGADEFDRRYDEAQAKARKKIEAQLGAAVDDKAFAKYHESLDRAARRAKERAAFQTVLGADFDPKGFNAYQRALGQAERDAKRASSPGGGFSELNKAMGDFNRQATFARNIVGQIKWPALITGAGLAAQAVSTLTAGATALGSALAPLSGALAAYPALGSAMAQATGTMRLATVGVGAAIGDLNTKLDTSSEAFKKLTPEAQAFAKTVDGMKQPIRDIQRDAQRGLFDGLSKGADDASKNIDVLARGVPRTAKVIGDLAEQAGKLLGSRGFGRDLETQMRRNDTTIRRAGEGGLHLANALRNVTLAAGPLVEWMTRMGLRFTEVVDKQAAAARESGKLARFFHETQVEMSRVVRIGGDLAAAFFNIARVGKPLGDDILVSLVKSAQAFRDWTDSARGQNSIARYFREARPGIFEAGRLIRDLVRDFVNLGRGNQIAPLLRQIRTQMLPALVSMVDQTTRAFGPALINAITQIVRLLANFAGSSGPLTETVKLIGTMAEGLNKLFARSTALKSAMINIVAIGGLVKAFQIAGAITGVTRLIGLLKTARTAAAGTAVAETAGAGAAGAAARTGARGVAAGVGAGIAGAIPTAAVTAGSVVLLNVIKDANKHTREWSTALDVVRRRAADLARRSNFAGLDDLSRGIAASGKAAGLSSREIKALQDTVGRFSRQANRDFGGVGSAVSQARKHFADFRRTGSNDLHGIHVATQENMHFIKRTLGEDSAAGKEALARNFRAARTAVRQAMQDGKISVRDGLKEIQSLMRKELAAYGITGKTASAIIKHGNIKPETPSSPGTGKARGGRVRRAIGGWIGRRGMVSDDVVPIGDGALAAYGEYLAHGSDGRAAVLNRHQAPVADMMLAAGGHRTLDQGADLSTIERALAPLGGLDRLFSAITRPHYLAGGGRLKRFAGGGLHLPENIHVTHQTAGLAGYPAEDIFGAPGTPVYAPVSGTIARLSGQAGGPGGGGPYGYSIYVNGSNGRSYFLTHFGSTNVRPGQKVNRSTIIGTVADYPGGVPDHIHEGVHGGLTGITAGGPSGAAAAAAPVWKDIKAPQTGVPGALGAIVQATLDRVTAGANQRGTALAASAPGANPAVHTAGPVVGGRGQFGFEALRSLWTSVGGKGAASAIMARIALRESAGWPRRNYGEPPPGTGPAGGDGGRTKAAGLWQILGLPFSGDVYDPATNARMAIAKSSNGANLHPWDASAALGGRIGGVLQRFAPGGRVKKKKHTAPKPTLSAKDNRGITRSLARREAGIAGFESDIRIMEREYSQLDTRFGLSDEVLLIENDDGSATVDQGALSDRLKELDALVKKREAIKKKIQDYRAGIRRLMKALRDAVHRLTRALHAAKGKARAKERSGYRTAIKDHTDRLTELRGTYRDLGLDIEDQRIDLLELGQERGTVAGTVGHAAPPADAPDPAEADPAADPTTADPATAPPTALDIAAGVQAALAEYKSQQSDLIRNFGANAVTRQAAFAPGGVLSGTPDLEGAALGALRGFGGGSNLAGSLGPGATGASVGVLNINFQHPPDNAPTLMNQIRFQVENGGVS